MSEPNIHTSVQWDNTWIAVEEGALDVDYEGAVSCPIGCGDTEDEAIEDLLEKLQVKGEKPWNVRSGNPN